jgi:hypothetical protein
MGVGVCDVVFGQTVAAPLARMTERASKLLSAGAYVHQYDAFGVGRSELLAATARVSEIAARYASL